jgi:hypothetical protein
MVQRYPSSNKPLEGERPEAPPPVQNAVKLMYVGAAISTVSLIISLIFISSVKPTLRTEFPKYTASQINSAFTAFILVAIISAGIGIGLWLWMARANGQGRNWARITSSVLFVIETLTVLEALRGPKKAIDLVFPILTWLVGLGAIWFLWRPESTAFFKRPVYR